MSKLYLEIGYETESYDIEDYTDFIRFTFTSDFREWLNHIEHIAKSLNVKDMEDKMLTALAETRGFKNYNLDLVDNEEEPYPKELVGDIVDEVLEYSNLEDMKLVAESVGVEIDEVNDYGQWGYALYGQGEDISFVNDLFSGNNFYSITAHEKGDDNILAWKDCIGMIHASTDEELAGAISGHFGDNVAVIINDVTEYFEHDFEKIETRTVEMVF